MPNTLRIRRFAPIAALVLFVLLAGAALAHPLGNFTINHYARLQLATDRLRVRYVLDLAEIPTFQEKQTLDVDRDGAMSEAEIATYLTGQIMQLEENLTLHIDGREVLLTPVTDSARLTFLPGQGGLDVMRLGLWFEAPFVANARAQSIEFRDDNYPERLGWREIIVRAEPGVAIENSSAPSRDLSQELTAYPEDLLANPPNIRAITLVAQSGNGTAVSDPVAAAPITTGPLGAFDRTRDEFGKLLTTNQDLSPTVLLVSFLAALALGSLHAFSPGHGKAVVGAYLVGSRGNWQHAAFLGLVVTATHTAGVYALGFVTLFLSAYILPEQIFPWLAFISGALVALIGIQLLVGRFRAARAGTSSFDKAKNQFDAAPRAHSHHDGRGGTAVHSHSFATPAQEAAHAREHLAEMQAFEKPSWKNLLSLGISGGLLPCPSALVVMLSAIALGRVFYGFFLIIGFSLGLAGVLVITGLVLLYAGRYAGRLFWGDRVGVVMRFLPVVGALFVTVLGIGIALEAFSQTGIGR